MFPRLRFLLLVLPAWGVAFTGRAADLPLKIEPPALWITAYYPGWEQRTLPPGEIDFKAITHLVQFSVMPKADGGVDWGKHGLNEDLVKETVRLAHAAGREILLCVGGADSAPAFRAALAGGVRAGFVRTLVEAVRAHGYDGLDIDMEPMEARDAATYAMFIPELRAALKRGNPDALLTAAVAELPAAFAGMQDQFDQLNLMTYALSGAWEGWVTWHNSALWNNGGYAFPGAERKLPCLDMKVREWLAAGVRPDKLGLGVAFYAYVWSGASGPRQPVKGVKTRDISHVELMKTYFTPERYHWDETAGVPYLSVAAEGAKPGAFISFDDERSLRLKIDYARRMKLGGAIIWELANDYRRDLPAGRRSPLLQAVHDAALGQ